MEQKLNVAEILKDKTENTKLYSRLFGNVYFYYVADGLIKVTHHDGRVSVFFSDGRYYSYPESEPLLLPSKEMQDWSKFAWKKGDVLVSNDGKKKVFFNGFTDDTYALFKAKHGIEVFSDGHTLYFGDEDCIATGDYTLEDNEAAQTYIKTIEKRLGRKLNLETLEIEKTQSEFEDGDILVTDAVPSMCYSKCIFILKGNLYTKYNKAHSYAFYNINNKHIGFDVIDTRIRDREIRLATDLEKLQLFDILTTKGKYWDAEKRQIVDIKPEIELQPFYKVLVRDRDCDPWQISLFGYKNRDYYRCSNGYSWKQCIPYKDNEHLLGTKNSPE